MGSDTHAGVHAYAYLCAGSTASTGNQLFGPANTAADTSTDTDADARYLLQTNAKR